MNKLVVSCCTTTRYHSVPFYVIERSTTRFLIASKGKPGRTENVLVSGAIVY